MTVQAHTKTNMFTWIAIMLAVNTSCNNPSQEEQRGGDHVPELKTYQIAALPAGAEDRGVTSRKFQANLALGSQVRFAKRYEACLDVSISDDVLAQVDAEMLTRSSTLSKSGLWHVLHRAFQTVNSFDLKKSSRSFSPELLVRRAGNRSDCTVVVSTASAAEFPFTDADFAQEKQAIFQPSQLEDVTGVANRTVVAFIRSDLSSENKTMHITQAVAQAMGIRVSSEENSPLNPSSDRDVTKTAFAIRSKPAYIGASSDEVSIYTWVAMYVDLIKLQDFLTLQHYADEWELNEPEVDTEMTAPASVAPITAEALVGNEHLSFKRGWTEPLRVCFQADSSFGVGNEQFDNYLSYLAHDNENRSSKGIAASVAKLDEATTLKFVRAEDKCSLLVAIRKATSFPFSDSPNNGVFVAEERIRLTDDSVLGIPVIYFNGTNLELDPEKGSSSKKYIAMVLEHDVGHFMGFRHSSSDDSLLSPAGYHDALALPDPDSAMLQAWLDVKIED